MPLNFLDLAALRKRPTVAMIGQTHLQQRGLNVIFGPSGSYKSFYALGLALEIAQNDTVIYVAAEGSSGLAARVDAWLEFKKVTDTHLTFLCREIDLRDLKHVNEFIKTLKKTLPAISLVIFDTYARCLPGGDENNAKDAGIVISHCALIQRQLDCATLLIHHTNRAERGERGSGAMRGGADSMIEIVAQGSDIEISCSKAKETEAWPTEVFRFQPYKNSGLLLPANLVPKSATLNPAEVRILQFLTLEVFDHPGATTRQIIDGTSIPSSSVYKVLSSLKRNSHINQDKKGDPYSITTIGESALTGQLSFSGKAANIKDDWDIDVPLSNSKPTLN